MVFVMKFNALVLQRMIQELILRFGLLSFKSIYLRPNLILLSSLPFICNDWGRDMQCQHSDSLILYHFLIICNDRRRDLQCQFSDSQNIQRLTAGFLKRGRRKRLQCYRPVLYC